MPVNIARQRMEEKKAAFLAKLAEERQTTESNAREDKLALICEARQEELMHRNKRLEAKRTPIAKATVYNKLFAESVTSVLTEISSKALLLDEDFVEKQPDYKTTMRQIISAVLESVQIPADTHKGFSKLCVGLMSSIPKKVGDRILSEDEMAAAVDELVQNVVSSNADDVEEITAEVQSAVVDSMDSEQERSEHIEESINKLFTEGYDGFYKEPYDMSLVESLAYNDAKRQILNNRDCDVELAVANGIMFQTVMESLKTLNIYNPDKGMIQNLSKALCQV